MVKESSSLKMVCCLNTRPRVATMTFDWQMVKNLGKTQLRGSESDIPDYALLPYHLHLHSQSARRAKKGTFDQGDNGVVWSIRLCLQITSRTNDPSMLPVLNSVYGPAPHGSAIMQLWPRHGFGLSAITTIPFVSRIENNKRPKGRKNLRERRKSLARLTSALLLPRRNDKKVTETAPSGATNATCHAARMQTGYPPLGMPRKSARRVNGRRE